MSDDTVKFILVDDIEENLLALEALLRRDGLEMLKARSGHEALELLLQHDVALALLDVQMPGMDGFELAELMRGIERTRQIPIIFLTAMATNEYRRFRGYEAGAVDYLLKPLDPQILKSKANIFFELGRQRQELARQRDALSSTASALAGVLSRLQAYSDNSPLAIVEVDQDFRLVSWSNSAERMFGWRAEEVVGKCMNEFAWVHPDGRDAFRALVADLRDARPVDGVPCYKTFRKDGEVLDCEWYGSALRDQNGRLTSVNWQILDVTERARAEETQRLLIGELNHRVKNTLATVQAIATQTLRHTDSPADFSKAFMGRIQALARAHSLLSSTTWRGADLAELVQNQLQLGLIDAARLSVSGPSLDFAPDIALHLALVLHELATNAHKYGAFAAPEGRVQLEWEQRGQEMHLRWQESGVPQFEPPSRSGFGTTLIERSLKAMSGSAKVSYGKDGICWQLCLPVPGLPKGEPEPQAPPATSASVAPISARPDAAEMASAGSVAADRGGQGLATASAARPGGLAGKRFLVIEDEPLVVLEIANLLEDAGAELAGLASSTEEAIQLIETSVPDGALLDANLHGEMVDDIAAELTRRKVPFLFVSGYGRENLPRDFGHVPVVGKPFVPDALLEAIGRLGLADDGARLPKQSGLQGGIQGGVRPGRMACL